MSNDRYETVVFRKALMELVEESKSHGLVSIITLPMAVAGLAILWAVVTVPRIMGWEHER